MNATVSNIQQALQGALSPVIVISGIGLLLMSLSNRYGRVIDRVRALTHEWEVPQQESPDADKVDNLQQRHRRQISILFQRAHVIRNSIIAALMSIFSVVLTVVFLFASTIFQWDLAIEALVTFLVSLGSLVLSLTFFIQDISMSLKALKLEIDSVYSRPEITG